jgi:hypothetical protein
MMSAVSAKLMNAIAQGLAASLFNRCHGDILATDGDP